MQHELLSCTDGLFPELRLLLSFSPLRTCARSLTLTHLCNVVRTNQASLGAWKDPCGDAQVRDCFFYSA